MSQEIGKRIIIDDKFFLSLRETQKQVELQSFKESLKSVFTARQIQIISRKLNKNRLTKTEQEYFSRTIKKKLIALSNETVYGMAKLILERM